MKNPRRIDLTAAMTFEHNLSKEPPPPDSLFWVLWNSCSQIAQAALETPFIQGIKAGTLDPVVYGGFNVNDAYYCFSGAEDYKKAEARARDPKLKALLAAKHASYDKYNATFPTTWRVRDGSSIVPYDVCREYAKLESRVASEMDPIYSVVVMLPCEILWAWLGAQLSPPAPNNLYASWITGNDDPRGAYVLGNFLDEYEKAHPGSIDRDQAHWVYTQAMKYEQQNFAAATAPPPPPT